MKIKQLVNLEVTDLQIGVLETMQKSVYAVNHILAAVLFILISVLTYLYIEKGFYPLMYYPLLFIPAFGLLYLFSKEIDKELIARRKVQISL